MAFKRLDLDGRRALVTGGTSGIGLSSAKLLSARGAKLLITGRDEQHLKDSLEQIPDARGRQSDASNVDDVLQLGEFVDMAVGQLDILVLNAGITPWKPLLEWEVRPLINFSTRTYAAHGLRSRLFTIGLPLGAA